MIKKVLLIFPISLILIASCGKTFEEKAEVAIISCNILEASPIADASGRIKEINRAREELNEEPFLGKDDEIIEAIYYNLCKELVLNDELYEKSLLTAIEQEKIAEEEALEAARIAEEERLEALRVANEIKKEEERKKIKEWVENNKETLAKITPLKFVKFAYDDDECWDWDPEGKSYPLVICYERNNFKGMVVTWEVVFKNGYAHINSNNTIIGISHRIYDFHLDDETLIYLENTNDLQDSVEEINIYVQGINTKYRENNNLLASEIRSLSNSPFEILKYQEYESEILGIKYQIYPPISDSD